MSSVALHSQRSLYNCTFIWCAVCPFSPAMCTPLSLSSNMSEVSWLGGSDKAPSVKSPPQGATDKPMLWPLCAIDSSSLSPQVVLINAVRDVAKALAELIGATKCAAGKAADDPSMYQLKSAAKVKEEMLQQPTVTSGLAEFIMQLLFTHREECMWTCTLQMLSLYYCCV